MSFFPVGMSTAGKIGTGLNLLGGISDLFGGSGDGVSGKQLGAQRVQNWKLLEQQKQYLWDMLPYHKQSQEDQYGMWIKHMYPIQQRQIQDRVTDAKAAGLHPLFALGQPSANLPAFTAGDMGSPGTQVGIPGQSVTGSHKGDKLAQMGSMLLGLDQQRANVKLTEAQTAYYNSMIKKDEITRDTTAQTYPNAYHGEWIKQKAEAHVKTDPNIYPSKINFKTSGTWEPANPGFIKQVEDTLGEEVSQVVAAVIEGKHAAYNWARKNRMLRTFYNALKTLNNPRGSTIRSKSYYSNLP